MYNCRHWQWQTPDSKIVKKNEYGQNNGKNLLRKPEHLVSYVSIQSNFSFSTFTWLSEFMICVSTTTYLLLIPNKSVFNWIFFLFSCPIHGGNSYQNEKETSKYQKNKQALKVSTMWKSGERNYVLRQRFIEPIELMGADVYDENPSSRVTFHSAQSIWYCINARSTWIGEQSGFPPKDSPWPDALPYWPTKTFHTQAQKCNGIVFYIVASKSCAYILLNNNILWMGHICVARAT